MANIIGSQIRLHPHYMLPEIVLQYNQASGAFATVASGNPMVRLSEGDMAVYAKKLGVRTSVHGGQFAANQLPSCTVEYEESGVPTYLTQVRAEYDFHDTAAFGRSGVSLVEAQRLAMRQGIFQQLRNLLLYGGPGTGEGLLNAANSVSVNLPADSNGNTTIQTYDAGQLAFFLLSQFQALKVRTTQMGMANNVVILTTQRILGQLGYSDIVQLVQFQRVGAGSESTRGMFDSVLGMSGDTCIWGIDDTLIGKGNGGTDAILMVVPEINKPMGGQINTNEFARVAPGLDACTLQLVDMAAPREITTPIAGGAVDVLCELRATPGWALRGEAITIISAQY